MALVFCCWSHTAMSSPSRESKIRKKLEYFGENFVSLHLGSTCGFVLSGNDETPRLLYIPRLIKTMYPPKVNYSKIDPEERDRLYQTAQVRYTFSFNEKFHGGPYQSKDDFLDALVAYILGESEDSVSTYKYLDLRASIITDNPQHLKTLGRISSWSGC